MTLILDVLAVAMVTGYVGLIVAHVRVRRDLVAAIRERTRRDLTRAKPLSAMTAGAR